MACIHQSFSGTLFCFFVAVNLLASTQPAYSQAGVTGHQTRAIVVISDLHMGPGRSADGRWNPKEDFRWSGALRGLLDEIGQRYDDQVDLVVAGDLLELWQPPADIACLGEGADLGCTIDEMKRIILLILNAHASDLAALGTFATRGANRVFVIPGNHDSALMVPEIWDLVASTWGGENKRVALVQKGVWSSADGQVVVEHGHQIGSDVNRYRDWPVVTKSKNGRELLIRPWGELFVQRLFNSEEEAYPIIDNLSPETAGARYRMADRGLWRSTADVARFIAFNAFETSVTQKGMALGQPVEGSGASCSRSEAETLGYKLVVGTLPLNDPFRVELEGTTDEARNLRKDLDFLVRQLPEEDIQHLCQRQVASTTLGGAVEARFVPRETVIRKHLRDRLNDFPDMAVFVYGHTHQLEEAWTSKVDKDHVVTILNDGAFQRLTDENGFLERAKKIDPAHPEKGLQKIPLDALAPCYGVVTVEHRVTGRHAEAMLWHMVEGEEGKLVSPGVKICR